MQARQARQRFGAQAIAAMPKLVQDLREQLTSQLDQARSTRDYQLARDTLTLLNQSDRNWTHGVQTWLKKLHQQSVKSAERSTEPQTSLPAGLELMATEVMENQLLASRLALSIQDSAGQEWTDLKLRLLHADGNTELATTDLVRPETLARALVEAWMETGLSRDEWKQLSVTLHTSASKHMAVAYRDTNQWLVSKGVMTRIKQQHTVRKATSSGSGGSGGAAHTGMVGTESGSTRGSALGHSVQGGMGSTPSVQGSAFAQSGSYPGSGMPATRGSESASPGNEWWGRARMQTQEVVGRILRLLGDFSAPVSQTATAGMPTPTGQATTGHSVQGTVTGGTPEGAQLSAAGQPGMPPASPRLQIMLQTRQQPLYDPTILTDGTQLVGMTAQGVEQVATQLRQQSAALKQAASTPGEKATIEIVALMFQSILSEERLQPSLRVWFARLQIPVLRVALAEPDFFGSLQHPARKLIDRMGSCALGFGADLADVSGKALETEIGRVVQVIEQYPETGRKVFQLALDEFQAFLARHLQQDGQTSRLVELAQQVEQKETLAVQYTIELRKLLNDMPVRDDIRDFMFKIWAEVLAVATVKYGHKHELMTSFKQAASDLLWAASAKPTRAERAQVIAQLPDLLVRLRKGMALLGMDVTRQDSEIKTISAILAQAFMSRTETIPAAQLAAMTKNLACLEDFLPQGGTGDLDLDQESIEMITGMDASNIVVITHGGVTANDAMRAWANELQLGSWFRLDHNNRPAQVQLAWRSDGGQLCLFITVQQHYYLMQTSRIAAYLQAGLLVPAEGESLTVRATRAALEKLDANPERLLS